MPDGPQGGIIVPGHEPWTDAQGEMDQRGSAGKGVEEDERRRRGTGIFLRAPLLFVPASQNRACWEQLRASLRRKVDSL